MIDLKKLIREIPDYPKPGILFYDITTLLKDPVGLHWAVDIMANTFLAQKIAGCQADDVMRDRDRVLIVVCGNVPDSIVQVDRSISA